MAIFNKNDTQLKNHSTDANTTIITAGSIIKGDMQLSCNLYVDGEFEGTINSNNEINIGKNGRIKGEITTTNLIVQGFVEGCIEVDRVDIKAGGKVQGTIEASELVIESKGSFEGNSIVKSIKQQESKKKA